MLHGVAYCGTPPVPGDLAARFNLDPMLIGGIAFAAFAHLAWCRRAGRRGRGPLIGWAVAAATLISPLCALSVALFSARIAQHMILLLFAAPLIAGGLPRAPSGSRGLWPATIVFMLALWLWHMPGPYDATLRSTPLYWTMHLSLLGAALWLWRELIAHEARDTASVLAAGTATSVQMGLLGALLTLGDHAWFNVYSFTTEAWGLDPLADQHLGGVLMWVPGCLLFLSASLRSFHRMWRMLEARQTA